jgi:hypothetical protein
MEEIEKLVKILDNRILFLKDLFFQQKNALILILLAGASIEATTNFNKLIEWFIGKRKGKNSSLPIKTEDLLVQWTSFGKNWDKISIPDLINGLGIEEITNLVEGKKDKTQEIILKNIVQNIEAVKRLGGWLRLGDTLYNEIWTDPFTEIISIKKIISDINDKMINKILNYRLSSIFRRVYRNESVHELIPSNLAIEKPDFFNKDFPYLVLDQYNTEWGIPPIEKDIDIQAKFTVSFPAKFLINNVEEIFKKLVSVIKRFDNEGKFPGPFYEILDINLSYWE